MSEQEENELICEKLLDWKRGVRSNFSNREQWWDQGKISDAPTPTFTTWAEAGMILEVLQKLSYDKRRAADSLVSLGDRLIGALLTPADIRAAALEYIKAEKP